MLLFRLAKTDHAKDISGTGGLYAEGRWSRKGLRVLYTSQSQALCFAELSVRLPISIAPAPYSIVHLEVPDGLVAGAFIPHPIPSDWKDFPYAQSTLDIGTKFLTRSEHLVMRVPSAIVPDEFNYIINPMHAEFKHVMVQAIEPFPIDGRLYNKT